MGCINMIYNNFDLNALKIFVAVYENMGIDKASKKLFISQPAVSISIKKLEEHLNGKLFVRLPKGIKPTEEGERFYNECRNALNTLSDAFINFSPENALKEGSLKIGASTSVIKHILMPVLKDFCKTYPNIKVSFTEVIASRLQRYLVNGDIDIAFMEEPIEYFETYKSREICKSNNCFVVSKAFEKKMLSKQEMLAFKYAVLKKNTNNRALFEHLCLQHKLQLSVGYEMASFETLAEICEHNFAIGFAIEEFVKDKLQSGKLKKLKTEFTLPQSSVFSLLLKNSASGYVCDKFLSYFKNAS